MAGLLHHKNKGKWDGSVIQFRVARAAEEVAPLCPVRGHPVLSSGSPYVSLTKRAGLVLEACHLHSIGRPY